MYRNTILMLLIRGVSILLTLISAPIMLNHVNRADYGVLLTLTSIVGWIGYMDVGLGNGLRNKLSEYLANRDIQSAKKTVSSCYAALIVYVSILILFILLISPSLNWIQILNTPNSNATEIRYLATIVFVAFCFHFLFGLINSILFAYQLPAFQSIFTFIGQVLAFIVLLFQIFILKVESVLFIGAANALIPPLVLMFASIILFNGRLKDIRPSLKLVNFKYVNNILSLGVKFFILQIISIVLFQANSIIITRVSGPEAVVEYNLAFKYIGMLMIIFNIIITPMWSATTDAYAKNDIQWISKTLKLMKRVSLVTILLGAMLVVCSKYVYNIWLGSDHIQISFTTTLLIYIYISFEMLYKVYGTIINGIGKVYAQMIITGIIAIIYLPTAIFLGKKFGLPGVLISNCVTFLCNFLWSKLQCTKIINGTAKGIWIK